MKKRTLVCFLIFTLCVFHFSITDTVFGQDATPEELAQQVFDEHNLVLRRANIKQYLPEVLEGLKGELPLGLSPAGVIDFAVNSLKTDPTGASLKAIAQGAGLTLTDDHIAIIADADVQAVLAAENTKALLSLSGDDLVAGLDKLLELINAATAIDPGGQPDPAPPTISISTSSPTTDQRGSFDVGFSTADVNGDAVTVTGSISVEPAEAAAYYSIPSGTLTSPVRITQVAPSTEMPTIDGATVTLTLIANDGTADSSPATFVITFDTVKKLDPAPPTLSITTSSPTTAQRGSFNVAFSAADVNVEDTVTVTGSISVEPAEAAAYYSIPSGTLTSPVRITQVAPTTAMPTIDGATVTLTLVANDGTADSSPATFVFEFATVQEVTDVNLIPSNLNGQSRLGGVSLNKVYARGFIDSLLAEAGFDPRSSDALVAEAVDFVLNQIPEGFLPKAQIRYALTADTPQSIFGQNEPPQLDSENFGNAISPALTDLLYTNVIPEKKYLADDNMNVYVRVPNALENGSVQFRLNGSQTEGKRISPTEFKADTIPYTFKLEETLAATNLPAWPAVDPEGFPKIFREVVLRYSQEGLDGEYIALQMEPYDEDKGVVWKGDVGIIPGRNVFYYFEVTLVEPVMLNIVNPIALGEAIASPHGTHDEGATKEYRIASWAMPDPRNLQFQDRGIIDALLTPDVALEIARIYLLSQGGNQIPFSEFNKLTELLGRNANNLLTEFESNEGYFDPKLASVFTVPDIDYDTESLWFANFDAIADGVYTLQAVVRNANGDAVDKIAVDFIGDSSAPEADITFTPIANADTVTTGYLNKDSIFVSTDKNDGPAALLDIGSVLTKGILGRDDGYLLYQVSGLDKDGNSITTWLPLTVESSMLASDLWEIAKEQLQGNPLLSNLPEQYLQLVDSLWSLPFNSVLGLITPGLIQQLGNPELAKLGIRPINDARAKFIVDLLGALVDDIDAIPLTYNEDRVMRMVFTKGEYGIRALGIDNLLNISSHVGATRLRVVKPEYDSSSITLASLGDLNGDGDADEPYESGTIYKNATDVTLTILVDERSGAENHGIAHPGTITVQYENADGDWVTIGDPIKLIEADHAMGTTFKHPWTVTDFDDLIGAGDSVRLRTITRNELDLTSTTPEVEYFTIQLDDDVHPVDPKVLVVDLNDASIIMTNPDSGAPQGTIQLIGYTPRRTIPATNTIRVEAKRMNDDAWKDIGEVELVDPDGMSGTDTAAIMFNGKALGEIYPSDTSMIHVDETSSYLKWTITVDTTMLPDTIEAPDAFDAVKLAAAHAASNPNGESYVDLDKNRYMVRATPVVDGELPENPNENPTAEGETYTDMFSVDNVDDVSPLGQNIITVSQDNVEVTPNDDGSFDVGGLVDKYDPDVDSPVITLTITPGAKRDTYDSVHLFTSLPEGAIIGDVTETAEGSGVFEVMVDVGTLMDSTGLEMEPDGKVHNDRYLEDTYHANPDEFVYNPKGEVFSFTVYALTEDAAENRQGMDAFLNADEILNADLSRTTAHEITVNVTNTYRPDPGVLAITVENSDGMVNPDSKAPKYELTFNAYTYGHTSPSRSSPPTEAVRFEVKRPGDETWERITGTVESEMVTDADLDDTTTGLTQILQHNILTGGDATLPIPILMKFSVTVDTREFALLDRTDEPIKLGDTIKRGDAAERDVSLDDNQYRVRAIALTPKNLDHPEYPQVDGVDAHFSLDNVDDVPPLGPTNITDIADHVGSLVANEDDGSFLARGIVDVAVESTKLTFSIEPTAEPITYENGLIRLVQTAPDGTVEELPPVDVSEGQIIVDIGNLENGPYMYYALTADEHGNWQVQGEDDLPSPIVTVNVLNFRVDDISDLTVTAVDGESPDRHVLQQTIDELQGRFPLKESIAVSFNVNNGSLTLADLTAVVVGGQPRDGEDYTAGSGDAANSFSLMANNLSELPDGWYTPHGRVTIRERFVDFPFATINLDNTGPMITILTPTEGATVNDLPTLNAEFNDGELGSGVSDGSGVSAADTVVVSLDRLRPEEVVQDAIPIDLDQNRVEQDLDSVVYTRTDKLAGGAYQFTVTVQDRLGNSAPVSVIFAIEGEDPLVVITAPASGQTLDHSVEEITGFFTGGGEVKITEFTINGETVEPTVTDNEFTYTLPEKDDNADGVLEDGEYTVAVEVTDGSDLTANTSLTFTVVLPVPTVAIHSPHAGQIYDHGKPIIAGDFSGADPVEVALTIDGVAVEATVNDNNQFTYTPTDDLSNGVHTVAVVVTDANGRTAQTSTNFTINIPGPTAMFHVPAAGQIYDISRPVVTGEFSGIATPVTLSLTLDGEPVEAELGDNTLVEVGNNTSTYTPFTYTPVDPLDDGEFTLVAVATDANGKTAKATAIFTIRLPVPTVLLDSPLAGGIYDHTYRHISGEFTGVHPIVVDLMVNGTAVEAMVDGNEFTYDLSEKLAEGEHTVFVKITDANNNTAQATTKFTVVYPEASVSIDSPVAGDTYDHTYRHISGEFMGVGEVVVSLSIDGTALEAMVDGNEFTYDLSDKLTEGEHTVSVSVEDENGETAQASSTFLVVYPEASVSLDSPLAGGIYDHTYRHISGEFMGVGEVVVSLSIDGTALEAMVDGNEFTYELSDKLTEGEHTVSVSVEDENGETAQASTTFTVVYPEASVMISSPVAGDIYDHTYRHITGEFVGVGEVAVSIMLDGEAVDADSISVEGNEYTYMLPDKLTEGDHMVSVSVEDENGETAQATTIFSVVYPDASVMISSPIAADTYDHTYRHISGEFTGVGNVVVSLSVDGTAVAAMVDGNEFTYDLPDKLTEGEHTVSVSVEDENGEMAEASSTFLVVYPEASVSLDSPVAGGIYDHTYRHISGEFMGVGTVAVSLSIDGTALEAMIAGNEFTYELSDKLTEGEHTVSVSVEDENGETAQASTTFTVVYPEASVMISSPVAGDIYDHTYRHITGEFVGVGEVAVSIMLDGEAVDADSISVEGNEYTYMLPDKLTEGDHMVSVSVEDENGETAQATTIFSVVYPDASVMISSPIAADTYDHTYRHISGEFTGVGEVVVSLSVDGTAVAAMVDGNEFTYDLPDKLTEGEHTVSVSVEDENGETAEASSTFLVVYPEASVSLDSPVAGGIYDHTYRHISGEFMGVGTVAVSLSIDGTALEAMIAGNEFTYELSDKLTEGEHTVSVSVEDENGETAQASTTFTVVYPEASVMISSPVAGDIYDHTYRHITGEFVGVGEVAVSIMLDGTAVDVANISVEGNEYTYMLPDKLTEGDHMVSVSVEDENGETAQATTIFSVVYPDASVMISSPIAADTYDHTYRHISGEFTGVGNVVVSLSVDGTAVAAMVDGNEFTYDLPDKLTEGEHTVSVSVEDENGETAEASSTFLVVYPEASVSLDSPVAGGIYDHTYRHISGEFMGVGTVAVSLSIDGTALEAMIVGNEFTYELSDKLTEGEHTVSVSVEDENGETAQASTTFTVVYPEASVMISSPVAGDIYDHTYRHITGEFVGVGEVAVSIMLDGEAVDADSISVEGNEYTYMLPDKLTEGDHMVSVSVEDENGETAQATTIFSVVYPDASVMISSPIAADTYDHTYRHISGEFTGVGNVVVSLSVDGTAVAAMVDGNEFTYDLPDKLTEGEHTVSVSVEDENGETAEASSTFLVVYPEASVSLDSPVAGGIYDHTYRHISGEFMGVGTVAVSLSIDGTALEAMIVGNEFTYELSDKLTEGEHTVSVSVEDENGETAQASTTFTVVYPEASVMISSPVAGDIYDHTYRHITGEFVGVGAVAVSIMLDGTAVDVANISVDGNEYTYMLPDKLTEGDHMVSVSVEDENGETAQATTIFSVVYPEASVMISSPIAADTYDHTYRHISGEFTGVGNVVVSLSVDGTAVAAMVDGNEFTYDLPDKLTEGEHTVSVSVEDENGETAEASSTFLVVYPEASVMISSPIAADTYDHTYRHISGEFTGVGNVVVSLSVDGTAVAAMVDGNEFTYDLPDKLTEGEHTVSVSVEDENGETAQASSTFLVVYPEASVSLDSPVAGGIYDHTYRHISGEFMGVGTVAVNLSVDGTAVAAMVDGNEFTYDLPDKLTEGEHTVSVSVEDENGETAQASTTFTVVYPEASVMISSPVAGDIYDHTYRHITGEFVGVGAVAVSIMLDGTAVDVANISVDGNEYTYVLPDKLTEGDHMVSVSVEDENGETAQATTIFSVVYPDASVMISSPEAADTYDHTYRHISGEFTGVGKVAVSLSVDGTAVAAMVDGNEFTYDLPDKLTEGEHTVSVSVEDENGEMAQASSTFLVVYPDASVSIDSPVAGGIYDHTYRHISGEFMGVGTVAVSLSVDGTAVDAMVDGNEFTYDLSDKLTEGEHTVSVSVEDENGEMAQASTTFLVVYPEASVSLDSPAAGHIYDHTFSHIAGEFTGVGEVKVVLTVDGTVVATRKVGDNGFEADSPELAHGEHTVSVEVTDANGETAQTSTTFTVDVPGPSVAILSPASGQTYEHGEPVMRVEYTGITDVSVTTFTINGEDVEGIEPEDNAFEYIPDPALVDGEYKAVVIVTDENDKTAKASVVFNIEIPKDTTPPVISEVSPSGLLRLSAADVINNKYGVTISAIVTDEQSDIIRIEYAISEGTLRPQPDDEQYQAYPVDRADGKFEISDSFNLGTHQISLIVESEGGVREHRWYFTLEADLAAPTITSITPSGTIHAGMPPISASAVDNSAVKEMTIVVMDSNGEAVAGEAKDDSDDVRLNEGITRVDFHPEAPLSEGTYTIEVRATDTYNNSSTATGVFTVDFDTAAPIITSYSPQNGARLIYKHNEVAKPTISIAYGDAETGVNVDSVRLSIEGPGVDQVINLTDEQKSASQVVYTPSEGFTEPGQYTVILEVSDNANLQGNVSEENDDARQANQVVHKFSFFVEYTDAPVLMAPFNNPNPFAENTRISFGLNQMSVVSIVIYDSTLRPVRVLVDNKLMPAGKHTGGNGIGWDGKTSSGESLARGIYYAQIVVTGGFEAEYAILKLALTGAK